MAIEQHRTTLVLGGARSGKSRYAERLALQSGRDPVYVATAQVLDDEMAGRIATHQERRGPDWTTIEEPIELVEALRRECRRDRTVLVDCLTLWLTNLMVAERPVETESAALVRALRELAGPVILVSNEVGQGIIPDNAMARRFVDHAGWLHQGIAEQAEAVVFMTAGLPQRLK
ncbi:MAG: bifunctional adenosylcobinamide kinase/adenosylcobinamide-phosphate guanylyltransferase [Pseudomonadota bacterium]